MDAECLEWFAPSVSTANTILYLQFPYIFVAFFHRKNTFTRLRTNVFCIEFL